jgi:hypothetical protein
MSETQEHYVFRMSPPTANNGGALSAHLRVIAERHYHEVGDVDRKWRKLTKPIPADWEIVEFVIVETNTDLITPASDLVDKMRRREILQYDHGDAFANLVERLEYKDFSKDFRWVLVVKLDTLCQKEKFLELLKTSKLKRLKDIHVATDFRSVAVAFGDKAQAMLIRLAWTGKITAVDLRDYQEIDLDN